MDVLFINNGLLHIILIDVLDWRSVYFIVLGIYYGGTLKAFSDLDPLSS